MELLQTYQAATFRFLFLDRRAIKNGSRINAGPIWAPETIGFRPPGEERLIAGLETGFHGCCRGQSEGSATLTSSQMPLDGK